MSILEILGIGLVLFSFMKNIGNWQKNLLSTIVFCFSGYKFLNKITKYKNLYSFSAGNPLCTNQPFIENGFCIYYDAVFTYFIGQLLWGYHAMSGFDTVIPGKRDLFYYAIHSIPIFGLISGHFNNWDLGLQLKTDLSLLTMVVLNGDFEIFTWFGLFKFGRFEEFDRSNFHHVCENIEKQSNIYDKKSCDEESCDEESCDEESCDEESCDEITFDNKNKKSWKENILRKHYNTRSRKRSLKTSTSY